MNKRFKLVLEITFQTVLFINLFLFFLLIVPSYFDKDPIDWKLYFFINMYSTLSCLIFGYMDKPKLENIILLLILITSLAAWIVPNDFSTHSSYIFIGCLLGSKVVRIFDLLPNFNK